MATRKLEPRASINEIQELFSGDPVELSDSFADLGGEINTKGAKSMGVYVEVDIGNSENVRIKALAKQSKGATAEYDLPIREISATEVKITPEYMELDNDVDQKILIEITLNRLVPYVQIQCSDSNDGDGQIDSAQVIFLK